METTRSDNADAMAYEAARTGQLPTLYIDKMTRRVVADVSSDALASFWQDERLQLYLSVKRSIWHNIALMRGRI